MQAHSPLAQEAVRGILGEELLQWMQTNFDQADTKGTGQLDAEQLTALVPLAPGLSQYTPSTV